MDTINRMKNDKAENSPSGKNTEAKKPQAKGTLPKESELNCRAVATLLKAVCCFLQLSRGLKLGNRNFEKYC